MTESGIEGVLARDGALVYKTRGRSMEPMLRQDRDLVLIRVPSARLRKYDVALYRRGGNYVLHRVVAVEREAYRMRGDNTYSVETVPDSAVIGVLHSFQRKGRQIRVDSLGYRCYARLWQRIYPLRAVYVRLRRLAARAGRRTGGAQ